jgi:hypothetical protein
MIDIGHMKPLPIEQKIDEGYIKGLSELIKLLLSLH